MKWLRLMLVGVFLGVLAMGLLAQEQRPTIDPAEYQATADVPSPTPDASITPGADPVRNPTLQFTEEADRDTVEIDPSVDSVDQVTVPVFTNVDDMLDDSEDYFGLTVTVTDEVIDYLNGWGFIIGEEDDEVLVLYQDVTIEDYPLPRLADDRTAVTVTGAVRPYNRAEIEAEVGIGLDFEDTGALLADYADRPVIVADFASLPPDATPGEFDMLGDINDRPVTYFNVPVHVSGDINTLLTERAFIIEQGNLFQTNRILVVLPEAATMTPLEEGLSVDIRGMVQPFEGDNTLAEYALDPDAVSDYQEGNAMVVAEVVTVDD